MSRWGNADDQKLANLFLEGKIPYTNVSLAQTKAIHHKYFNQFPFRNFSPLFKKKCRQWTLEQSLKGKRDRK